MIEPQYVRQVRYSPTRTEPALRRDTTINTVYSRQSIIHYPSSLADEVSFTHWRGIDGITMNTEWNRPSKDPFDHHRAQLGPTDSSLLHCCNNTRQYIAHVYERGIPYAPTAIGEMARNFTRLHSHLEPWMIHSQVVGAGSGEEKRGPTRESMLRPSITARSACSLQRGGRYFARHLGSTFISTTSLAHAV